MRGEHGYPIEAHQAFADIQPLQHDVLVIPGGPAAEALTDDKAAVRIAVWFIEQHRPNQEVANDGEIVTSRRPADLPAFMRELIKLAQRRRNATGR